MPFLVIGDDVGTTGMSPVAHSLFVSSDLPGKLRSTSFHDVPVFFRTTAVRMNFSATSRALRSKDWLACGSSTCGLLRLPALFDDRRWPPSKATAPIVTRMAPSRRAVLTPD